MLVMILAPRQQIDLTALKATASIWRNREKTLIYLAIDHQAAALFAVTDQGQAQCPAGYQAVA